VTVIIALSLLHTAILRRCSYDHTSSPFIPLTSIIHRMIFMMRVVGDQHSDDGEDNLYP